MTDQQTKILDEAQRVSPLWLSEFALAARLDMTGREVNEALDGLKAQGLAVVSSVLHTGARPMRMVRARRESDFTSGTRVRKKGVRG